MSWLRFRHANRAVAEHVQVAVDNIDADLFGRGVTGGFFQPSDAMKHKIRTTVHDILREAYRDNMVRDIKSWRLHYIFIPVLCNGLGQCSDYSCP